MGWLLVGEQSPEVLEQFGRKRIYLIGIATEWLLLLYVRSGVRALRPVVDPTAWTSRRWIQYVLIAVAASVVWSIFGFVLGKSTTALRPDPEDIRHLMVFFPRDAVEKVLWIVLSISAGFCEEVVYRGYIQQQLHAILSRRSFAVVLQAIFYAIAHAALPWEIMVIVTLLGILFGAAAALARSLVPGILLHAAMDVLAVFARPT